MKNKLLGLALFVMFGFASALHGTVFSQATVKSFVDELMLQEDMLTVCKVVGGLAEQVQQENPERVQQVNFVKIFIKDFTQTYGLENFYNFLNNWFESFPDNDFQRFASRVCINLILLKIANEIYESQCKHLFGERFESFIQSRNTSLASLFEPCEPHADDLPGAFVAERPEQQPENIEPTVEGKRNFNPIYYTLAVIAGCGLTFLVLGLAVDYGIIKQSR